jgi:hypothetical protein
MYNAIVAGSTNQDYRMQPAPQPVTDPRKTTSRIQQR